MVEGEKTVAKNVVKREITLKKDQHYSESARRNSLTQLYAHPLFDQAEIQISEQSDTASLILDVRVTEEEMRSFQWRIGAGYFDRLERPIRIFDGYQLFRTQLSWVHRNLGGGGQQFTAGLKLSYFERYIEADYLFPFVFNTNSSIRIHPFSQYRDERAYNINSNGVETAFSYVVNNRLTGTISYRFALNDESNVEAGQGIPDSLLTYNLSVFNISSRYHSKGIIGYNTFLVQPTLEFSGLFGKAILAINVFHWMCENIPQLGEDLFLQVEFVEAGYLNKIGIVYPPMFGSIMAAVPWFEDGLDIIWALKNGSNE